MAGYIFGVCNRRHTASVTAYVGTVPLVSKAIGFALPKSAGVSTSVQRILESFRAFEERENGSSEREQGTKNVVGGDELPSCRARLGAPREPEDK